MSLVTVTSLTKRHPGQSTPVLQDVSFSVEPGQVAAILGRSGAGKTTLLRCLVGLEVFERGTITVGSVTVKGTLDDGVAQHRAGHKALHGAVGMVFQSLELFPHLSVLDNCTLAPCLVQKLARNAAQDKARGLLEVLGVLDKASTFPDALSGGQKQRVAIARALCMEPRVLCYDEPTSALDETSRAEVAGLIRQVAQRGVTQVLVAHDVALARAVADVAVWLDVGRVTRAGTAAALLDASAPGAAGSPASEI